jgi:signal transduction histidine kinase
MQNLVLEDDMQKNFLRLDEDSILVEQLRLLLRNVGSALVPTVLLCILLVFALSNDSNTMALRLWGAALMSSKLLAAFHARRQLASSLTFNQAHRLVWILILFNIVDGLIWGAFTWVTLSTSTTAGSILIISTIAGIVGSSMARLSAVMPIFIAFVSTMLILVAVNIWRLHDPAYDALALGCIFYLSSIMLMARNSSREILAAIKLRFENIALMEQLQVKTEIAETAQREAEHANTAKSKFLAAASHDLRQPIHAQGLFLEVLSRTEQTPHQQELLASARAASEASGEMLNTLLDFSRIDAGVIEPQLQPFHLQPLLNKIENELAPQADAKNIVYRSRETHVAVQSDPVLLELILRNLVSNAIRYTERGGVLVACRQRGSQAVIEIWDTGIGIAPENQQEVFREFHQLGNPERDRHKGLGLGLAIADGLARTLEHRLSLTSTPLRGSVFRLALPIATEVLPDVLPVIAQSKARLLEVRVLVIDDDEIVRDGMLHLLRDWGCECQAAESIEEALALAHALPPDLVISDYRLREQLTGVEAIAALRTLLGNSLPALLITGDTAPKRLREAKASGVPLLHKPVSPSQLYRKLVEILEEIA